MRSFWFDPYLWVHLAGAAAVPIWLEICFLGLALGDPLLPPGLEIFLVAVVGVVPTLWMQWQRPFYIFSLLVVALKTGALTPNQRRLLRFFKSFQTQLLALVVPVVLTYLLWFLQRFTPLVTDALATLPVPQWHLLGLLVAAIAFLLANLFLQVPVSVLRVLLASEQAVAQATPYPIDKISEDFTSIGFEVTRILPPIEMPPAPVAASGAAEQEAAEAGSAISELAEPEPAESELAESETVESEPAESEPAESEMAEPEMAESEPAESEMAESEPAEPEMAESEAVESEPAESELAESEPAKSEMAEPEIPESEPAESEMAESEMAEPELAEAQSKDATAANSGVAIAGDREPAGDEVLPPNGDSPDQEVNADAPSGDSTPKLDAGDETEGGDRPDQSNRPEDFKPEESKEDT